MWVDRERLLTDITNCEEASFRTEFLRLRLEVVQMCQEQQDVFKVKKDDQGIKVYQLLQSFSERDNKWMEDTICCLKDLVKQAQMKSVMNIADLTLP